MGDKEQIIEQQSYVFDDLIIEEILVKLPIKFLIQIKSVSKQWYSIISSSKFAISHFMKSPFSHPSDPVNTLFIQCRNNYYLFSYDDDQVSDNFEDSLVEIEVPFRAKKNYPEFIGGCNGLICLTPKHGDYFIIWNPATGNMHKYKADWYLLDHDIVSAYESDELITVSGFGYASSIDDYKFVQIFTLLWKTGGDTIVYLFSFRENKWRKIEFDYKRLFSLYGQAVLSNEKLYWGAFGTSYYYIVSFDLVTERFDAIQSPLVCIGDMGGFLGECIYKETFTGDKLIRIVDSDAIVKSIDIPKEFRLDVFCHIVGFTRTGNFFANRGASDDEEEDEDELPNEEDIGEYGQGIWIVDPSKKPIQYKPLLKFHKFITFARYVPSLVSPFLIKEPSEAKIQRVAPRGSFNRWVSSKEGSN